MLVVIVAWELDDASAHCTLVFPLDMLGVCQLRRGLMGHMIFTPWR